MRVLAVTHGPDVGPELLGEVARDEGHDVVEWDIRAQGRPSGDYDAVIVLGGSQNVGEEVRHPWLHEEYDALRGWLADGTPLLGVCLGAQTLAAAAGATVAPVPQQYAGFYETVLTPAGVADPVLGVLPARFAALNANGYGFDVPADAVELATAGALKQAFRVGERAWGVQFHPEARYAQVLGWFRGKPNLPKPLDELAGELNAGMAAWQSLGRQLGRAFLAAATR